MRVGSEMQGRTPAARARALLMLLFLCGTAPLAAQDTVGAVDPSALEWEASIESPPARGWQGDAPASPLLPPDHWAVRAASRAEALGLADGYLPAQRAVPRAVVHAVLEHAARTEARRPEPRGLAAGWLARFREEFREYGAGTVPHAPLAPLNGHAALGWDDEAGRLSPAIGYFGFRRAPEAVPARSTPRLDLAAGTGGGGPVAGWALARWDEGGVELARWEAVAAAGPFAFSAGRQPLAYGWGTAGGVVLSPRDPLPRVEAQTLRPVRLPWVLGRLGRVSLHTFAARMADEERHPTGPWLWGARLALQPHPRFTLGVNRGAIFGGEGREVTPGRLAGMVVGVIRSDFENQIVSGDVRWRLPTEAVLPLTAYLEWGADDGAGALDEQPGILAGLRAAALPGLPGVGLGVEGVYLAECCGHGGWYFNASFPGNWARGTQPLGHPLGGEGWEAAALAEADLLDGRLRLAGRAFARERRDYSLGVVGAGNLFSPDRTGRSTGMRAEGAFRLRPGAEVRAMARGEQGAGWSERAVDASFSLFF